MTFTVPIRYFSPQISSVKNFWIATRVKNKTRHWRCKSSVENVYSICETAWNLLISEHILRYELARATLGRKKISVDLILLIKLKYRNKQNKMNVVSKNIFRWNLKLEVLRIFNLNLRKESWWCGTFLSCFCSNSLMNCVFRCEMKWNDYLLEMRLVLISNI